MSEHEREQPMKAGRELDCAVAERVMGLRVVRLGYWGNSPSDDEGDWREHMHESPEQVEIGMDWFEKAKAHSVGVYYCDMKKCEAIPDYLAHYSTDIAAAWQVVEKCAQYGVWTVWETHDGWNAGQMMDHHCVSEAMADTAPHAICLAALKAVGYKENTDD